jgi:hypothetical protein
MTKVRNHLVPVYWAEGKPASNHGGCFTTDGKTLYSYGLLIGDTCPDSGSKILRDYTANGNWGYRSQTTSVHVGRARTSADLVD